VLLAVFWTTAVGAGAVSVEEMPRAQAGVDNSGIRQQFDAGFDPDGGLDACELPLN